MTFNIIEPHADDAFLSLGGHIDSWIKKGYMVNIVTVFSGTRKRAVDAEMYAKKMKCSWRGLGFIEGEPLSEEALLLNLEGEVIVPLSLTHNEHLLVRELYESNYECLYYLDQPYALIQKNTDLINDKIKDKKIYSYLKPNKRKYKNIPLFKDRQDSSYGESGFLCFFRSWSEY